MSLLQHYKFSLLIILFFIFLPSRGDSTINRFEHYSISEGLSHTHILSIFQDSKGLIWFGTYGGLHLFNGYNFQIFTAHANDTNSISNHSVNVIFEDKDGFLWFGTENGLNKYDRRKGIFTRYLHDINSTTSISHNTIKTIYQDSDGIFWIGTYGGGLNKFDPKNFSFECFNSEKLGVSSNQFDKINTFLEDSNGIFWIGTEDGGIFLFDSKTEKIIKHYKSIKANSSTNTIVTAIVKDKENTIWVGTWEDGLYNYNRTNETFTYHTCHSESETNANKENIRAISEDNYGNLWLAQFGAGLTKFNKLDKSYTNYYYNSQDITSISSNYLWSLYIDKTGNLWAGTFGGGINKYALDKYDIPFFQLPKSLCNPDENNGISSILEDHKGVVWLGTLGSGIIQYNYVTNKYASFKYTNNKKSNAVLDIFEDSEGQLWIGTNSGLFKIDSLRTSIVTYRNIPNRSSSITANAIYHVSQDRNGNIWLGTWNDGVQMLASTEITKKSADSANFISFKHDIKDENTLSNNIVYSIFEDSDDDIWIGTSQFLEKLDPKTGELIKLQEFVVGSIIEDDDGTIWVGSLSDGFYNLNKEGEILKSYISIEELPSKTNNHLPNSTILGMTEDNNNDIWLSTNKGFSIYSKQKASFANYSLKDELHQNALSLKSITTLSSGLIVIGGIDGFNIINPENLNKTVLAANVVFTNFKLFNKSIVQDITQDKNARIKSPAYEVNELILSNKDKLLLIEFAALEYSSPHRINYAYKLEGFDENWINTDAERRYANYSNLMPGEYIFKVKATNNRGIWNSKSTTLKIIVTPPYWKTFWFRIASISIGCLIVLLIIRIRTKSLKTQKKILELLVEEKTFEILKQNRNLEQKNLKLSTQKDEITAQKNEIVAMTEELKKVNDKKLRFFTSMSHEFRTPLTLILGPIEQLIDKYKTDKETESYLSVIQKNGYRLLRLINELLDLRKLDTKNMKVHYINGDILCFVNNIIKAFKVQAKKQSVNLEFYSSHKTFPAWFDPGKLEIIFYNLISNALKFTPPKGKITIDIKIDSKKELLQFSVEDTGSGIDANKVNKIFDRFYQAAANGGNYRSGAGIGLSLTKEIIELMQGSIEVESALGKGTSFTIMLPIISQQETQNASYETFSIENDSQPTYGLISQFITEQNIKLSPPKQIETTKEEQIKILVVEDDSDLRSFIKSCLSDYYRVFEAPNGKDGLVIAKEVQPELIISDIMMPVMGGIEFCKRIKEDFSTSHIPVILLSARTSLELQLEGFETGADAFIPKPFNKKYLLTRTRVIIHSREKLREKFQNKINIEPKDITVTSVDELFLKKAKELIEENIANAEFGVPELVKSITMSRTLLHMKFKKLTGCSTGEFIKTMRLKRACQLLSQNSLRVSDICYQVGYNDPPSFTKVFKKQYGITPTQYAKNNLAD